jgi:hypothetical protein
VLRLELIFDGLEVLANFTDLVEFEESLHFFGAFGGFGDDEAEDFAAGDGDFGMLGDDV